MGMDGQRYAPAALLPGNRPGTPCIGGWVRPRAFLDGCKKSRPPPGFFYFYSTALFYSGNLYAWVITHSFCTVRRSSPVLYHQGMGGLGAMSASHWRCVVVCKCLDSIPGPSRP